MNYKTVNGKMTFPGTVHKKKATELDFLVSAQDLLNNMHPVIIDSREYCKGFKSIPHNRDNYGRCSFFGFAFFQLLENLGYKDEGHRLAALVRGDIEGERYFMGYVDPITLLPDEKDGMMKIFESSINLAESHEEYEVLTNLKEVKRRYEDYHRELKTWQRTVS